VLKANPFARLVFTPSDGQSETKATESEIRGRGAGEFYLRAHARACRAELTRKLLVHYKTVWAACSTGSRTAVSLDIQLLVTHRLEVSLSPHFKP